MILNIESQRAENFDLCKRFRMQFGRRLPKPNKVTRNFRSIARQNKSLRNSLPPIKKA